MSKIDAAPKIVRWEPVKEHRGDYFVEYKPAAPEGLFVGVAVLVYVIEEIEPMEVGKAMEKELEYWLKRFPVPLIVMAVDHKEDNITLPLEHFGRCLSGYIHEGRITSSWQDMKDNDYPEYQKTLEHRKESYTSLEAVHRPDIQALAKEQRTIVRTGWWLVFLWAAAIPAVVALLCFLNVLYLGAVALAYSLFKASRQALKLLGLVDKSDGEEAKEREQLQMKHHHYYCKRDPQGFERLKSEYLKRECMEEIQKESNELLER